VISLIVDETYTTHVITIMRGLSWVFMAVLLLLGVVGSTAAELETDGKKRTLSPSQPNYEPASDLSPVTFKPGQRHLRKLSVKALAIHPRQLQQDMLDFSGVFSGYELGAAELGFLVGILFIVALVLLLCCCCCRGGSRSSCSLCDILAALCLYEMCCDGRGGMNPGDFVLV